MIKVNKRKVGIPDPSPGGKPRIYPWHQMDIGDWFDAPLGKQTSIVSSFGRMKPKKFTTRKWDAATVRVWRVE